MRPLWCCLVIAASILYVGVSLSMFPSPVRRRCWFVDVRSSSGRASAALIIQQRGRWRSDEAPLACRARAALDATVLEADLPRATREISCPTFSGPGYVKERHPSRPITVPVQAPYESQRGHRSHPGAGRGCRRCCSPIWLLPAPPSTLASDNLRFLKQADTNAPPLVAAARRPRACGPKPALDGVGAHGLGAARALPRPLPLRRRLSYAATGDAALGHPRRSHRRLKN